MQSKIIYKTSKTFSLLYIALGLTAIFYSFWNNNDLTQILKIIVTIVGLYSTFYGIESWIDNRNVLELNSDGIIYQNGKTHKWDNLYIERTSNHGTRTPYLTDTLLIRSSFNKQILEIISLDKLNDLPETIIKNIQNRIDQNINDKCEQMA